MLATRELRHRLYNHEDLFLLFLLFWSLYWRSNNYLNILVILGVEVVIAPPVEAPVEEEEEEVIFMVVESMPEFPGGQQALFKYLAENVKYPVIAQENGIQGRVICQFVVNKDGSIVDVVAVRSSGEASLDKEAIRVIKSMPKWKPGKQRGKPVRVKYTVPVNFRLQ